MTVAVGFNPRNPNYKGTSVALATIESPEQKPFVVFNIMQLQQSNIFILKALFLMMRALILNIFCHAPDFRTGNRKNSVAILPRYFDPFDKICSSNTSATNDRPRQKAKPFRAS
jgi:hypothetical protein